jgi:ABC-type antimicrobial peptide transport system permease subunit
LLTYTVGKRTNEIGIRMALGAKRRDVLLMIIRESLGPVLIGVTAGTAGAFAATRYVQSLLFGMSRPDTLAIGGALLLLVTIGVVSAAIPARQASRIDPLKALRYE